METNVSSGKANAVNKSTNTVRASMNVYTNLESNCTGMTRITALLHKMPASKEQRLESH